VAPTLLYIAPTHSIVTAQTPSPLGEGWGEAISKAHHFLSVQMMIESTARSDPRPPPKNNMAAMR
jgi:hypothetical protein